MYVWSTKIAFDGCMNTSPQSSCYHLVLITQEGRLRRTLALFKLDIFLFTKYLCLASEANIFWLFSALLCTYYVSDGG